MSFRTVLILTLTTLSLGAQGRLLRPEHPRRDPSEHTATPRRDRIVARLHEIRARKLQETLGLTEEKANAIADRWSQFDEESFSRRQQMVQLVYQVDA